MLKLSKHIKTGVVILGTALVTAIVLIVGFLVWFDRVWTVEKRFVRISPYQHAVVPGEPVVSTKLYQLGEEMRFLLVLSSKSDNRREMYYINGNSQEIGVPDYSVYRPFWKGALVQWTACDGFEESMSLAADWDWINDKQDLRIRVKGFCGPDEPNEENTSTIRLTYGRDIVLVLGV